MDYETMTCPFCEKGEISCYHFPSAWCERRSGRNALGSGKSVSKSKERLVVRTDCSVCGKTKEEISKWLK